MVITVGIYAYNLDLVSEKLSPLPVNQCRKILFRKHFIRHLQQLF